MPDELAGGGAQATGTSPGVGDGGAAASGGGSSAAGSGGASSAPAAQAAAQPAAGAGGSQAAAAGAGQGGGASDWVGVRDALKGLGVDLGSQYQDDNAALAALGAAYRDAQRLRQMEPLAREYQQYQGQFQAWRHQQAEAERQRQQQAQQWFKAPEYDPTWQSKLTRDPNTGEIRVVPGAPPDTAQKYLAWVEHQQNFVNKFAQDPIGAIKPGLEQMIRAEAEKIVREQLGGYQNRVSATDFISQHSQWLHQRDANGHVLVDPGTGVPALSPLGQRFAGYVQEAVQAGMSLDMQQRYALKAVQADYALEQLKQQQGTQQAVGQGDAAKAAFLQQQAGNRGATGAAGNPATGAGAVQPGAVAPANGTPLNGRRGLQERMLQNMKAGGYLPGQELDLGR